MHNLVETADGLVYRTEANRKLTRKTYEYEKDPT